MFLLRKMNTSFQILLERSVIDKRTNLSLGVAKTISTFLSTVLHLLCTCMTILVVQYDNIKDVFFKISNCTYAQLVFHSS